MPGSGGLQGSSLAGGHHLLAHLHPPHTHPLGPGVLPVRVPADQVLQVNSCGALHREEGRAGRKIQHLKLAAKDDLLVIQIIILTMAAGLSCSVAACTYTTTTQVPDETDMTAKMDPPKLQPGVDQQTWDQFLART